MYAIATINDGGGRGRNDNAVPPPVLDTMGKKKSYDYSPKCTVNTLYFNNIT